MISVVEFQERRKKLALSLNDNSIAIVSNGPERFRKGDTGYPFTPNPNFYYLTGFTEADAVAVIIKLASKLTYHLFSQKIEPLKTIWTGERIGQERACSEFLVDKSDPLEAFSDFLKNFAAHNQNVSWYCDFNDEFIKSKLTNQLNLNAENLSPLIAEMRLVKSKAEIAVMQSAADISSRAHRKLMGLCRPGLYEYELEAEFIYRCHQQGARFQAYTPIVASGANACILHYEPNNQVLRAGDLVLIDAGCEYQHYASDITRTIPVNGKFNPEQRAIYQIVLNAQLAVIAEIKPGIEFSQLQTTAITHLTAGLIELGLLRTTLETALADKTYRNFFMHGVSHWLGLNTHDVGGYEIEGKPRRLVSGSVLTVEPGIYISKNLEFVEPKWRGIGIRIEDDILVTEQGSIVLSNVPKEIAEIEALMIQSM